MSLSTGEVIQLFAAQTNVGQFAEVQVDDVVGGVVYIGWTSNPGATTAVNEWAVVRVTTVASDISYELPKDSDGLVSKGEVHIWDDRAALTY